MRVAIFLVAVTVATASDVTPATNREKAEAIHRNALSLAMNGEMVRALARFRTAAKLNPTDVRMLNDLGVTEMRLGHYETALRILSSCRTLDSTFEIVQKNIEELGRYLPKTEINKQLHFDATKLGRKQKHELKCPREINPDYFLFSDRGQFSGQDHIDLNAVYYPQNFRKDIDKLLLGPFIVRNAASKWKWDINVISNKFLKEVYGNEQSDFYPQNMDSESVSPFIRPLRYALEQLESPDEIIESVNVFSGKGSYVQWNIRDNLWSELLGHLNASIPKFMDDRFWIRKCFPTIEESSLFSHKTHWRMVLIGNENSGMFNHPDTLDTGSWQMQLKGKKRWHICSPLQSDNLYSPGKVDAFDPDYQRFPKYKNASCYQVTLNPGDFIYYPGGYWHQTKNLSPQTVSISDTTIYSTCHQSVAKRLEQECNQYAEPLPAGVRSIFTPDPMLCHSLKLCFKTWHDIYLNYVQEPNEL